MAVRADRDGAAALASLACGGEESDDEEAPSLAGGYVSM